MNAYRPYAGIGSRETPTDVIDLMRRIGFNLAALDYTLRSGAAPGADTAFEEGAREAKGNIELFLPWPDFQGRLIAKRHEPTERALAIAREHHPAWGRCSSAAKLLHGRNSHIILGAAAGNPFALSRFVICWTPGAVASGGTGQAIRVAKSFGIPVYDLADDKVRERVEVFLSATPTEPSQPPKGGRAFGP